MPRSSVDVTAKRTGISASPAIDSASIDWFIFARMVVDNIVSTSNSGLSVHDW